MTDWFRSWHGAPTDPKWLGIAKRAGVAPGIAVAVGWALMDRASQAEQRGSIAGYDADGLAYFFGCEPEQVDAVVTAMRDKGMIADDKFSAWERRQPKREDDSSERVREYRKRSAEAAQRIETPAKRNVTQRNAPETETEKKENEVANATSQKRACRIPDEFEPDLAWATSQGLSLPSAITEAAKFRDYWRGKGSNATKTDWPATWRNWVRTALDSAPRPQARGSPGKPMTPSQLQRQQLAERANELSPRSTDLALVGHLSGVPERRP